jgi:hypothetical protein
MSFYFLIAKTWDMRKDYFISEEDGAAGAKGLGRCFYSHIT